MYTDRRMMKRLQLVRAARPVDHCPIVWRIRAELCHLEIGGPTRVDQDRLMEAVRSRPKRRQYIEELETELAKVAYGQFQNLCEMD